MTVQGCLPSDLGNAGRPISVLTLSFSLWVLGKHHGSGQTCARCLLRTTGWSIGDHRHSAAVSPEPLAVDSTDVTFVEAARLETKRRGSHCLVPPRCCVCLRDPRDGSLVVPDALGVEDTDGSPPVNSVKRPFECSPRCRVSLGRRLPSSCTLHVSYFCRLFWASYSVLFVSTVALAIGPCLARPATLLKGIVSAKLYAMETYCMCCCYGATLHFEQGAHHQQLLRRRANDLSTTSLRLSAT